MLLRVAFVLSMLCPLTVLAQESAPAIEWQQCFGGTSDDYAFDLIQTTDGGYAFIGYTTSMDGEALDHHASQSGQASTEDIWVVKMNPRGVLEWEKCLGGTGQEEGHSIIQTPEGGYAIAARSESNDGDVHGNHGGGDGWVAKLDDTGKVQWQECFGGDDEDAAYSIVHTLDGGYAFAGFTRSIIHPDLPEHYTSGDDAWVITFGDPTGPEWQRWLGGDGRDQAFKLIQTRDSGFVIAGLTNSSDGNVTGYHGNGPYDGWVAKVNPAGQLLWQRSLGGSDQDWANSIAATSDGGFVVVGFTKSTDGDVSGNHGGGDGWVVKLDSIGEIEWQRCLGGTGYDAAWSVVQSSDGGYAIGGYTASNDGDVSGNHGGGDAWVVKLDSEGAIEWQKCLGGTGYDIAWSIVQSKDGGYAISGFASTNDGDISGQHGGGDAWVVKLQPEPGVARAPLPIASREALDLTGYPRAGAVVLGYDLPRESENLTFDVTTINGKRIKHFELPAEESGHHEMNVDVSGYASGTYYFTVSTSGLSQTKALQIVR